MIDTEVVTLATKNIIRHLGHHVFEVPDNGLRPQIILMSSRNIEGAPVAMYNAPEKLMDKREHIVPVLRHGLKVTREIFGDKAPDIAVFVAEAWMARYAAEVDLDKIPRPKDADHREECLLFMVVTETETWGGPAVIDRTTRTIGDPILSSSSDKEHQVSGRMHENDIAAQDNKTVH